VKILTAVAIAALLLAGCAKKNDTPEAIREGVLRDISKSFNVSNMDVVVDSVSFRDKEADATVTYMLKGGSASQGMTMRYVMERRDDKWYIKSRAASPAGAAPAGGGDETSGGLPAGHPVTNGADVGGASGASGSTLNLPPGHPALGQ
jgi:hypothetical protein